MSNEPDFTLYDKIIEILIQYSTITADSEVGTNHTLHGIWFSMVAVQIDNYVNNPKPPTSDDWTAQAFHDHLTLEIERLTREELTKLTKEQLIDFLIANITFLKPPTDGV